MARYLNTIAAARSAAHLSPFALANALGVSIPTLHRIEAGVQPIRFDQLGVLCSTLNQPAKDLFPNTKAVFEDVEKTGVGLVDMLASHTNVEALEEAGIDTQQEHWIVKFRLRNRFKAEFQVSGMTKRYLAEKLREDDQFFVVFDSQGRRIALNTNHALAWQFLYEIFPLSEETVEHEQVSVYFTDSLKPMKIAVDGDSREFGDEANDGFPTQLQNAFFTLDLAENGDADETVEIVDEDGEQVVLRVSEIVLLTMPIWAVEPAVERFDDDSGEAAPPVPNLTLVKH